MPAWRALQHSIAALSASAAHRIAVRACVLGQRGAAEDGRHSQLSTPLDDSSMMGVHNCRRILRE